SDGAPWTWVYGYGSDAPGRAVEDVPGRSVRPVSPGRGASLAHHFLAVSMPPMPNAIVPATRTDRGRYPSRGSAIVDVTDGAKFSVSRAARTPTTSTATLTTVASQPIPRLSASGRTTPAAHDAIAAATKITSSAMITNGMYEMSWFSICVSCWI